ncbi:MAG: RNA methylase DR1017 [uncultured Nocardioidaceae bacterium]|uniref:RNA methylase DR1017 n=1 Tax=uncultured Nocardioidaceae bacterium TaxID=253824 RepID=A0A6J4MTV0_9ACTN|nr:MAG: RNA methylase DR1017 [uncultured Nocardioidaceae bacterium]
MSSNDGPASPSVDITSPANPRVKWLVGLRKRRHRLSERVTLVEGYDELRLVLDAGVVPQTLYYAPALVGPEEQAVRQQVASLGTQVVSTSPAAFARASYRDGPDGWLAVVADPARPLDAISLSDTPLVLVSEGVEKPGNLGAMLRTAEAAGVDAVVAASPVTDWGNPNVVRASKGTVFTLPVASATTAEVYDWARLRGLRLIAATPQTDTPIGAVDLTGPTAVVVGAEHTGVSDTWLAAADVAAKVPMFGRVNSLNVATSAALVVYEAVRQRASDRWQTGC